MTSGSAESSSAAAATPVESGGRCNKSLSSARSSRADSILISVLFKYFHFTCTRFGCSFLVCALYGRIFQLGFCMAQRTYSCTLKKGYARNVCAFTHYDTLTCLTRVLTFSYYHWCHASTELCLFFRRVASFQCVKGRSCLTQLCPKSCSNFVHWNVSYSVFEPSPEPQLSTANFFAV